MPRDRTPRRGGWWHDHRQVIDAIAFKCRTGTRPGPLRALRFMAGRSQPAAEAGRRRHLGKGLHRPARPRVRMRDGSHWAVPPARPPSGARTARAYRAGRATPSRGAGRGGGKFDRPVNPAAATSRARYAHCRGYDPAPGAPRKRLPPGPTLTSRSQGGPSSRAQTVGGRGAVPAGRNGRHVGSRLGLPDEQAAVDAPRGTSTPTGGGCGSRRAICRSANRTAPDCSSRDCGRYGWKTCGKPTPSRTDGPGFGRSGRASPQKAVVSHRSRPDGSAPVRTASVSWEARKTVLPGFRQHPVGPARDDRRVAPGGGCEAGQDPA